jgi:hypothetical protein
VRRVDQALICRLEGEREKRDNREAETSKYEATVGIGVYTDRALEHSEEEVLKLLEYESYYRR